VTRQSNKKEPTYAAGEGKTFRCPRCRGKGRNKHAATKGTQNKKRNADEKSDRYADGAG